MAFAFKMQKILDYREQLEEEAKVRLANAEANLRKCRERLDYLRNLIRDAETALYEATEPAQHWLHEQYLKGLNSDLAGMLLEERMLAQIAEEARKHLAACAIDRKVLEKLKERHKTQFVRAEQKQELNFNDEIATIRHKAPAL